MSTISDPFSTLNTGTTSPANRHYAVTPADEDLPIRPRALYVNDGGDLVLRDTGGVDVTYTVEAGQIIPLRPIQVRAATTATVIAWY